MSGVKNLVSNTGVLLRGEPFSHVKSPKAKGVSLSPAGPGSGDCSAAGMNWLSFSRKVKSAVGAGAVAGAGAAASAGAGVDAADGTFITRSYRVALLATTKTG